MGRPSGHRDDPKGTADLREKPLREDEQLGLEGLGEEPHLVEEDRAAIGGLKQPGL